MLSDADYAPGKPRMRNEMNRKMIGHIGQCIGHEHDEMNAHGLWTKLEEMYREKTSQNKSLIEKACVEASEREYSGRTNERVPEIHRKRSKEEARERGLKKEVTEVKRRGQGRDTGR
ncbi:hypothetical protein Acr_07g0016310 [Actinidia rufa]|uniref:Uncharacterized protein n=1 Tax=Actinidia rufa TaxID=165716 RepID=A0A7J0EYC2_9ERIC|nr:hypothetical protein Acr_07g0016310 [Actinidia rufa]